MSFGLILFVFIAGKAEILFSQSSHSLSSSPANNIVQSQTSRKTQDDLPASSQNNLRNLPQSLLPSQINPNEFVLPAQATPEQLLDWAAQLMTQQRSFETKKDYDLWLDQMFQAVLTASEKVISSSTNDETYLKGCNLKARILYYQWQLQPTVFPHLKQFVDSMANDSRILNQPDGRIIVSSFQAVVLQGQITNLVRNQGKIDDLKQIMKDVLALILRCPEMSGMIEDSIYPVTLYAEAKKQPNLVNELFGEIYQILKQSDNPEHQKAIKSLEGILRFSQLPGQEMTIEGTLWNNLPFDPETLKGKVVIVDFWATWCVPCHVMGRDLLKLYEQYKDQGLTIVGYSIDDNIEELSSYLQYEKIPWPTLSEKISVQNNQLSLNKYYGISSVPTLILIGKDGKVIKTDPDLKQLTELLNNLFKQETAPKEKTSF